MDKKLYRIYIQNDDIYNNGEETIGYIELTKDEVKSLKDNLKYLEWSLERVKVNKTKLFITRSARRQREFLLVNRRNVFNRQEIPSGLKKYYDTIRTQPLYPTVFKPKGKVVPKKGVIKFRKYKKDANNKQES